MYVLLECFSKTMSTVPYGKNLGGKKPWQIETNLPKFFLSILVNLDDEIAMW